MKLTRLITASAIALLPLAAGATNLVIPAAGTGPGFNDSRWETEVTLHNSASRAVDVLMTFRDAEGVAVAQSRHLPARQTIAIQDIVKTVFGRETATGAIEITDTDSDPRNIAVTSRTSNVTANGEFGQDIPAIAVADAAQTDDVTAITGPSSAVKFRFNFGLYVVSEATVRWELIRADGTVAATKSVDYRGATQHQYNQGVASLLEATPQDSDVIHATVTKGGAVFYGSVINQQSNDPSFVPGVITKVDPTIRLVGIDRDLNGTVDIADANGDGVLDSAIDAYTFGFPSFFRIVTAAEGGNDVTFEILSSTSDARLVDGIGTIQLVASVALKGTTGELKVRVTADGKSTVLTLPVKFF
jgi:hypothetical protein